MYPWRVSHGAGILTLSMSLASRFRPGFTVLEVLIVLAVFALFATFGVLSLNSARARVRDAQRLSNMSALRSGLGQYWLEKATYPISTGVNLGQPGTGTDVFTNAGFLGRADYKDQVMYLEQVPVGPKVNEYYQYKGGPNGYSIRFRTESDSELGRANVYYAHSTGIDLEDAEK